MPFHLKDRDLQRKLDDLSDGEFSRALTRAVLREKEYCGKIDMVFDLNKDRVFVDFGKPVKHCTMPNQFKICFEPETIEETEPHSSK